MPYPACFTNNTAPPGPSTILHTASNIHTACDILPCPALAYCLYNNNYLPALILGCTIIIRSYNYTALPR